MIIMYFDIPDIAVVSKDGTFYVTFSDSGNYLFQTSPDQDISIYDGNTF